MAETVEAIKNSDHYASQFAVGRPRTAARGKRGRGVASGFWFNAGLKSAVSATVNSDGTVALVEGSTDIGGSRASIAMQLAETLGIAAEDVTPTVADTDSVGYTDVTGGSRVTFATGMGRVSKRHWTSAGRMSNAPPSSGTSTRRATKTAAFHGRTDKSFTFKELAAQIHTGEPIIGRARRAPQRAGRRFGTHCVDVEVDPGTGKVDRFCGTRSRRTPAPRFTPATSKGRCKGARCRGSAGR
jgi:xanthine dehydrogenase molybdenum-binding subunit